MTDLLLTAIAPAVWGSSDIVTTQLLPDSYPLAVAMLRALPRGCALGRSFVLGPIQWLGMAIVIGSVAFTPRLEATTAAPRAAA